MKEDVQNMYAMQQAYTYNLQWCATYIFQMNRPFLSIFFSRTDCGDLRLLVFSSYVFHELLSCSYGAL